MGGVNAGKGDCLALRKWLKKGIFDIWGGHLFIDEPRRDDSVRAASVIMLMVSGEAPIRSITGRSARMAAINGAVSKSLPEIKSV